jgi:hypothetical protein
MPEKEILSLERQFWMGDAKYYERHLAPGCLMVFPAPGGVMDRAAAIEAVGQAPRWKSADFTKQRVASPAAAVAVIAYEVSAARDDGKPPYRALCSSTYVELDGAWKLALHQQTPVEG